MPLTSTEKERRSLWGAASWLVGVPVVLMIVSIVAGGFFGLDLTGAMTMMLLLGLVLSGIDGLAYVRGEDPHGTASRKDGGLDVRHLPRGDASGTYVVVDNRARSKSGEPRLDEFGPVSYALWFVLVKVPRTVGDLLLSAMWKGIAAALGRRRERTVSGTITDSEFGADAERLRGPEEF